MRTVKNPCGGAFNIAEGSTISRKPAYRGFLPDIARFITSEVPSTSQVVCTLFSSAAVCVSKT